MKESFVALLKENLTELYIKSLPNNKLSNTILDIFHQDNILSVESNLIQLFETIDNRDLKNYANPYYIGFGNPNADLLVIGKEKAFDSTNLKLLVKESINNYQQWLNIKTDSFSMNQLDICSNLGFNPLLPKSYHSGKSKRNHTWSIISIIIRGIYDKENILTDEDTNFHNSFFSKCFLTELNHIPAKYHEGSGLQANRASLLKKSFFKSFPVVIFSAKSYIGKNKSMLFDLFNVKHIDTIILDTIGNKRKRNITLDVYKSEKQVLFLCNQLSGASGWSDYSLRNFSKIINQIINH